MIDAESRDTGARARGLLSCTESQVGRTVDSGVAGTHKTSSGRASRIYAAVSQG